MLHTITRHFILDYAISYALDNAIINLKYPELKKSNQVDIIIKWSGILKSFKSANFVIVSADVAKMFENQSNFKSK